MIKLVQNTHHMNGGHVPVIEIWQHTPEIAGQMIAAIPLEDDDEVVVEWDGKTYKLPSYEAINGPKD
jgi:hypothetical protein